MATTHGFGEGSNNVQQFYTARSAGRHRIGGGSEGEIQHNFSQRIEAFTSMLKSTLAELELMIEDAVEAAPAHGEGALTVKVEHASEQSGSGVSHKRAHTAVVLSALLASPSDVGKERDIVENVIHLWNAVNFRATGIILHPVRWETHSFPASGARPQAIINKQIVDEGDFLIGIFGNRLGTPTGEAESGTIEEIERFRKAGKHVALYFSAADVPRSADREQLKALEDYQRERQKDTLYATFKTPEELRNLVSQHLPLIVDEVYKQLRSSQPMEDLQEELRNAESRSETRLAELASQTTRPPAKQNVNANSPPQSDPQLTPALPAHKPEPNIKCVGIRPIQVHASDGKFYESPPRLGEYPVTVVCFRNEGIVGKKVQQPDVRASIIYKDHNGTEITDLPSGVWLEEYNEHTEFILNQKKCLIIFLLTKNDSLKKLWKEQYSSENSWMSGSHPVRVRDEAISGQIATIELQLLDQHNDGVCVKHIELEVESYQNGQMPKLKIKPTSAG